MNTKTVGSVYAVLSQSATELSMRDKVLGYKNSEFVERLKDKLGLSNEDAEQLFRDMKQFLYLCGTRPGICSPTDAIDSAWHEFLQYTMDYATFCDDMFGRFVHHVPRSYLSPDKQSKGKTWRTYQVALQYFGELSPNWEVPKHMQPGDRVRSENVVVLELDNCGDSCGCGPACNGD